MNISIESQTAALSALQSRLSEGSFATETVSRLHSAAGALGDLIAAKTSDSPERKAQRISEGGQRYLSAVNRASIDLDARELGGLASLNKQFADRVGLNLEGYRWAAQVTEAFRAATQTEKVKMLAQIVESGDGRAMAALLEAPSFLHGVDGGMLQRYRESMEAKWAPDVTAKRERFDSDLEIARTAIQASEQIASNALQVQNIQETLAGAAAATAAEQALAAATE
jgi:hypothetical protein